MTRERLALAIERLDRALARVERAAEARPLAAAGGDVAGLSARHERLRARTQEAIEALDRLVGPG